MKSLSWFYFINYRFMCCLIWAIRTRASMENGYQFESRLPLLPVMRSCKSRAVMHSFSASTNVMEALLDQRDTSTTWSEYVVTAPFQMRKFRAILPATACASASWFPTFDVHTTCSAMIKFIGSAWQTSSWSPFLQVRRILGSRSVSILFIIPILNQHCLSSYQSCSFHTPYFSPYLLSLWRLLRLVLQKFRNRNQNVGQICLTMEYAFWTLLIIY